MIKPIIRISGTIITFVITINFYIFLLVAMTHDDIVVVYFNHFGEGLLEYVVYLLLLPVIMASFCLHLKEYRREMKDEKRIRKRNSTSSVGSNKTE